MRAKRANKNPKISRLHLLTRIAISAISVLFPVRFRRDYRIRLSIGTMYEAHSCILGQKVPPRNTLDTPLRKPGTQHFGTMSPMDV